MGIDRYVVCDADMTSFELGKGAWFEVPLNRPTRAAFDLAVRKAWCTDELDAHEVAAGRQWAPIDHRIVSDGMLTILVHKDKTDEQAIKVAYRARAYAARVAAKLWAYCEARNWKGLRHVDDCSGDMDDLEAHRVVETRYEQPFGPICTSSERLAEIRRQHDGDVDSIGTRRHACLCWTHRHIECPVRDLLALLDAQPTIAFPENH